MGRFSDGKLIPDLLASMLGIKEMVPPFLQPNLSNLELLTGVNFASAGSGYDDDLTSDIFQVIPPISKQPKYFKQYIEKLSNMVGKEQGQRMISRALIVISTGFVETRKGCCGTGMLEAGLLCSTVSPV